MGHPDFRVGNRVFASLWPKKKKIAVVKLSIANQTALLQMDPDAYSLNGWSRQGWTNVHLDKMTPTRFRALAKESWSAVAEARVVSAGNAQSLAQHFATEAYNNAWANHRLYKACCAADAAGVPGRAHELLSLPQGDLNHILTVDWYYLEVFERSLAGLPPHERPWRHFEPEEPFDACADLAREQLAADRRLIALCASLDDAQLDATVLMPRRTGVRARPRPAHPGARLRARHPPSRPGPRDARRHAREAAAAGRVLLRQRGRPARRGLPRAGILGGRDLGRARRAAGRLKPMRYVAFLRAVNVGGRTILRMSDLAKRLGTLGFTGVGTFIASGNVYFTAKGEPDALARRIEADLLDWLGYPVATMVRTWDELAALVASNPFKGVPRAPDAKLYVAFLWEAPRKKLKLPLVSPKEGLKLLRVAGREAFLVCVRLESGKFGYPNLSIEKELGVPATTRNWNTILRLSKLEPLHEVVVARRRRATALPALSAVVYKRP